METTTMEIVEFPLRQIVTTNCRLSNNGGDETRYRSILQRYRRNGLPNTRDRTLANGVPYPVRRTPT
jgi:hypothetical protein